MRLEDETMKRLIILFAVLVLSGCAHVQKDRITHPAQYGDFVVGMRSEVCVDDTAMTFEMLNGNEYSFTYADIMSMPSWKFVELATIITILDKNDSAWFQPEFMDWVERWLKHTTRKSVLGF